MVATLVGWFAGVPGNVATSASHIDDLAVSDVESTGITEDALKQPEVSCGVGGGGAGLAEVTCEVWDQNALILVDHIHKLNGLACEIQLPLLDGNKLGTRHLSCSMFTENFQVMREFFLVLNV